MLEEAHNVEDQVTTKLGLLCVCLQNTEVVKVFKLELMLGKLQEVISNLSKIELLDDCQKISSTFEELIGELELRICREQEAIQRSQCLLDANESLNREILSLKLLVDQGELGKNKLTEQLGDITHKLDSTRKITVELHEIIETNKANILESDEAIRSLKEEISTQCSEKVSLKASLDTLLDRRNQTIEQLEALCSSINNNEILTEVHLTSLLTNIHDAFTKCSGPELFGDCDAISALFRRLTVALESKFDQHNEIEQEKVLLSGQNNELNKKLGLMDSEYSKSVLQNTQLEEKNAQLTLAIEASNEVQEQLRSIDERLTNANQLNESLREDVLSKEIEIASLMVSLECISKEKDKANERETRLSSLMVSLQKALTQFSDVKLADDFSQLSSSFHLFIKEFESKSSLLNDLTQEINCLRESTNLQHKELVQLREKDNELESVSKELLDLQEILSKQKERSASMEKELNTLRASSDEITKVKAQALESVHILESGLEQKERLNDAKMSQLINQLKGSLYELSQLRISADLDTISSAFIYLSGELEAKLRREDEIAAEHIDFVQMDQDVHSVPDSAKIELDGLNSDVSRNFEQLDEKSQDLEAANAAAGLLPVKLDSNSLTMKEACELHMENLCLRNELIALQASHEQLGLQRNQALATLINHEAHGEARDCLTDSRLSNLCNQ
ncbi:unnamed protein product, partial [Protopolystoma xenopodis]